MVLCSQNVCEFKTEEAIEELELPFLRCLKTKESDVTSSKDCPLLEVPNVVAGLPAQGTLERLFLDFQFIKLNIKLIYQIYVNLDCFGPFIIVNAHIHVYDE